MSVAVPGWLSQRGGALQMASDKKTWFVMVGGQPQYALQPVPVGGQLGCAIRQTINGRRVESTAKAPTAEAALQAGLEELRNALGW
jgi:hypothetical protein